MQYRLSGLSWSGRSTFDPSLSCYSGVLYVPVLPRDGSYTCYTSYARLDSGV